MAYNPKLSVYIITLRPKKDGKKKTFRDFLCEKYSTVSAASDAELLERLFQSFVNQIGEEEFYKDDKTKKVIGIDDSQSLPLTLSSNNWLIDGVIEGGKYGILREYADTEKKAEKKVILPTNAVLDKYYLLLNPILNDSYAILLVQSYTEESIQSSVNTLVQDLFGGIHSFYKPNVEPFVPKRLKDKYQDSAVVRMFSFTTPLPLSDSLRDTIPEANQEFEVEVRIKPKGKAMSINSDGTKEVINAYGAKMVDGKVLSEGEGKIYMADALGRNANYDIAKEIQSIRPTIYLSDEGISSDPISGLPDFQAIKTYCHNLLPEIKAECNINHDIDEF